MARKQRSKGRGPGLTGQPGVQQQKPAGSGGGTQSGGWGPLRDAVRREIEQAGSSLAFAERLHSRLDTQRRLFTDFPRVMEQLRSGALERVGGSLSRLYEGGQAFDLTRFLRDLPLALSQLAAPDAQARRAAAAAAEMPGAGTAPETTADAGATAVDAGAATGEAASGAAAGAPAVERATLAPEAEAADVAASGNAGNDASGNSSAGSASADGDRGEGGEVAPDKPSEPAGPVSPRLELRSKLLAAAPQLTRAAQAYRRSVSTVRRAAAPRRSPGPWRSDREVLEEARRAVDFARQLFDAYAEAWADRPLTAGGDEAMAAEADRFLAWTQLNRYVELAVHGDPRHPAPSPSGKRVVQPVNEAPPGAVVAAPDPGPAGPSAPPPVAEPAAPPATESSTSSPDAALADPAAPVEPTAQG